MEGKIAKSIKIFPWYAGLTSDLLFYIAIDTLFLTVVKNFSATQIVSLTSISTVACIVLRFPLLALVQKIGNTASVRLAALCMLLSSLLITFGPNYFLVAFGRVFHDIAGILHGSSFIALKNNLQMVDRRKEFIKVRTAGKTVYSVITMAISFVATLMFNINPYLPMFGCIATCITGFILSFFVGDYSEYDKISPDKDGKKVKLNYNKFIILTIVIYGIFYALVNNGQSDGKLFIQQQLFLDFSVEKAALIIGAMVSISRVVRVFANLIFAKIYEKYGAMVGVGLAILLCSSLGLMIFGSFIKVVILKIIVMSLGYMIFLFIRDPYQLYMQDVIFDNTPIEHHQTLLAMLGFATKVAGAAMSMCFTLVLLKFPMIIVMVIMFVITIIELIMNIHFYKIYMTARHMHQLDTIDAEMAQKN